MQLPGANLARSLRFGGIRRNACTESRRLITRRSQVQILPPLLQKAPGTTGGEADGLAPAAPEQLARVSSRPSVELCSAVDGPDRLVQRPKRIEARNRAP